jgi:hypothetical protein
MIQIPLRWDLFFLIIRTKIRSKDFSKYQIPLPLPPLIIGVVLYCLDRRNILENRGNLAG